MPGELGGEAQACVAAGGQGGGKRNPRIYLDGEDDKRLHIDGPWGLGEAEEVLCPDVGTTVNREYGDMKVLSVVFSRVGSSTVVADGGQMGRGKERERCQVSESDNSGTSRRVSIHGSTGPFWSLEFYDSQFGLVRSARGGHMLHWTLYRLLIYPPFRHEA